MAAKTHSPSKTVARRPLQDRNLNVPSQQREDIVPGSKVWLSVLWSRIVATIGKNCTF